MEKEGNRLVRREASKTSFAGWGNVKTGAGERVSAKCRKRTGEETVHYHVED